MCKAKVPQMSSTLLQSTARSPECLRYGCASRFCAYPPRERWVGDAAAYNRSDVPQRLAFCKYPLREKWVVDVVACVVRLDCRGPDRQHHVPTSNEVGMQHQSRLVVGSNIKTHLSRDCVKRNKNPPTGRLGCFHFGLRKRQSGFPKIPQPAGWGAFTSAY